MVGNQREAKGKRLQLSLERAVMLMPMRLRHLRTPQLGSAREYGMFLVALYFPERPAVLIGSLSPR